MLSQLRQESFSLEKEVIDFPLGVLEVIFCFISLKGGPGVLCLIRPVLIFLSKHIHSLSDLCP